MLSSSSEGAIVQAVPIAFAPVLIIHLKFYLEDCFNLCVGLEEFLVQWSLFKEKLDEEEDEEDDIKEAFKMYDKDGDGYITREEMLEAITAMGFVRY